MPTLYRTPESAAADAIQSALDEMVIAHDIVAVDGDTALPDGLAAGDLPALQDDGDVLTDPDAIEARLDALRTLMADWDRFQSDACYLDDDGTIC
jgi:glutathione S-transferase